jgi:hypothetical protein
MEIRVGSNPEDNSVRLTATNTPAGLGVDGSCIRGGVNGGLVSGTYRLNYRHAASAAIPHDADTEAVNAAMEEMYEIDRRVTEQHAINDDPDCRVCHPAPYRPYGAPRRRRVLAHTWDVIMWTPEQIKRCLRYIWEPE